jgi:glycerophosphoryl diester phosphodiesterase
LKESRAYAPEIALALLVENTASMEDNIANLGFVPYAYSPHYRLVDGTLAARSRAMGMRLIPWTVNDLEEMQRLLKLGVDGIITDYPDRIPR